MTRRRIVILGAAGRDFHDFNVVYRDAASIEVVAFTATQIPGIAERRYPVELAGSLYPDGIPIVPEAELEHLCHRHDVHEVVFAYSDVPHAHVMHLASRALASGADFSLLGPERTSLCASRPVIAVSAVRTGCGKSQTTRWLAARIRERGLRVAVLRHPMPYGDLARQAVQRFASPADLDSEECTIEEREEYEPLIQAGHAVWAGVDYAQIAAGAAREADVILWDGGNNDFPFLHPDLHVVLVDALRPDQTTTHHPGETVLRSADVVVVAKVNAARDDQVEAATRAARIVNPHAPIVRGASPVRLENEAAVRGRRVVVVEDGPTITHGGMAYGAGYVAASRAGASEIVDPRSWVAPELASVFRDYAHIGPVLPAMGYGGEQLEALRRTLEAVPAGGVVARPPGGRAALIGGQKSVVRARYEFADVSSPGLGDRIDKFLEQLPRDA